MDTNTINEPWYLKNITIFILLLPLSVFPFASILLIPLLYMKFRHLQNYANIDLEKMKDKRNALEEEIRNKDSIIEDITRKAQKDAAAKLESVNEQIRNLKDALQKIDIEYKDKKEQVIELNDTILLQDFALYKPQYDFAKSSDYKDKLEAVREQQKAMLKNGTAATGDMQMTFNNSVKKGNKMVSDMQKLMLRAFNNECEHVIGKVKYNNFDSCRKRIVTACRTIGRLGNMMRISISEPYYELKIQELHLALEYQQAKQKEKEHMKELREQAREEAKLKKEIAEARKKIEKEKTHYSNALATAQEQLGSTEDAAEKEALTQKIQELREHLGVVDKNLADVDYREANERAGYVYVISNLGSFGPDIYKIGMTRRLDPMERVNELGDASVPFNFDVHAMIFSDDAPKLEAALHNAFDKQKLNMVNTRREFFHVPLSEIERVVKENFDGSVEFEENADAEQYRESQKIRASLH